MHVHDATRRTAPPPPPNAPPPPVVPRPPAATHPPAALSPPAASARRAVAARRVRPPPDVPSQPPASGCRPIPLLYGLRWGLAAATRVHTCAHTRARGGGGAEVGETRCRGVGEAAGRREERRDGGGDRGQGRGDVLGGQEKQEPVRTRARADLVLPLGQRADHLPKCSVLLVKFFELAHRLIPCIHMTERMLWAIACFIPSPLSKSRHIAFYAADPRMVLIQLSAHPLHTPHSKVLFHIKKP
jgi:hypothetical protein